MPASEETPQIFWLDGFNGEANGGGRILLRNPLKSFFDALAEKGINPVAIIYDGTFNLEILVENNEALQKHLNSDNAIQP